MIDLNLLKENPELAKNVRLEISGADLIAFGKTIHQSVITECEKNAPKDEVYLTPQQVADLWGVSLVTLWSWDNKGITKPIRLGNTKRYRKSDFEKILSPDE
jgi:hypothetical protein